MAMETSTEADALAAFKQRARTTWAAGDYDAVADGIWPVGEVVVDRTGVRAGDRVLDVACGTGNAATRAALAGGSVVGLDITPELFPAARRRAEAAGVEVELVEGDAEALPFDDASFDVVLSTFGVMFAPRHAVAAAEIARVLRPGGRIGLASWAPDGSVGAFFATVGRHLPAPPPFAAPPILWGTEDHVRELFAGTGIELSFTREVVPLASRVDLDESPEFFLESFGPLVMARRTLEPEGRWPAFEADAREAIARMQTEPPAYLLVTGTNAARD